MKRSFYLEGDQAVDTYALFRGVVELSEDTHVSVKHVGASWYRVFLDGEYFTEGPARFSPEHPEYLCDEILLTAGAHVVSVQLHYEGVETRILKDYDPFLWVQLEGEEGLLSVDWKGLPLNSCKPEFRRINPQLAWVESRDTRKDPVGWESLGFDDGDWLNPAWCVSDLPEPQEAKIDSPVRFEVTPTLVAEGPLATSFGYADDDPGYTFFTRDRTCVDLPAKGVWRRYDLGRVRLGSPRITLDVQEGTVIEIGFSEFLTEGRVSPWINFSLGQSCNWDRFIARGGVQTFEPFTPKGARFVEIHVLCPSDHVSWMSALYSERGYHAETEASLSLGDELLQRIWSTGVETLRGCTEDALIDNPTRERGQWVGDVVSVGLGITSVAYHDLSLCRRGLQHSAECAREDGLVAGMSPGGCVYLPTYSLQWTTASVEYYRHSRDLAYLKEYWRAAEKNMAAIMAFETPKGLGDVAGWNFVDWGYLPTPGGVDLACNLHYLEALRSMVEWGRFIEVDTDLYFQKAKTSEEAIRSWLAELEKEAGVEAVGYHCLTLAIRMKLFSGNYAAAIDLLKRHWATSFPSETTAHRLDDPFNSNQRLSTPYFAHYLFPVLIDAGEWKFVLEQIKLCWGWMLEDDRTTWVEVFDTRWSHCHQWAGAPTWILSRYVLGLFTRSDRGLGSFDLKLETFGLPQASGRLPIPGGGWVEVSWERKAKSVTYRLNVTQQVELCLPDGDLVKVASGSECVLDLNL